MNKVFVTIPDGDVKDTFLPLRIREELEKSFFVTYNKTGRELNYNELTSALGDVDAVITGWGTPMLSQAVLENAKKLKLIAHTGGTVGNLVDSSAYDKGICVLSGNRLYAESVAEGTLAYMLTALRRIPDYVNAVKNGGWRTEADNWEGLLDRTVGIVGVGTISTILIELLQSFRVKIKVYSHYPIEAGFLKKNNCERAKLEEIFSTCDIVSVHSALNTENRGLIRREHFEMLKDGCLFLNTSRGDVIDEDALIDELKKGRFRAILDVFHQEPLASDSPLRKLENVYCVPHMAGPTIDRRPVITMRLIEQMQRFFAGERELELEITREIAARMTKM